MQKVDRTDAFALGGVAGFIGFATSAVVLGLVGVLEAGSPFLVPSLLGSLLFYDGALGIAVGPTLAYNGLHLVIFLLAGLVLARLAIWARGLTDGWYLLVVGFLFVAVHALAIPVLFGDAVRFVLPVWLVVGTSALSFGAMAAYLVRRLASEPGAAQPV